jgi:hypothetical protein
MKKTEFQDRPSAISAEVSAQKKDAFDEARALYDRMADEARRQAEAERRSNRRRGPLVRTLQGLMMIAVLAAAITFFYGIYMFPDAPLRQTNEGFANKQGKPRTKEDFEKFKLWEKAFLISFSSVFVFGFAFGITDYLARRRKSYKS